jgi:DNA-binding Lrp family transcriptional regulator
MEKMDKCYSTVQQSGAKGLKATEIARKLGIHRTTAYKHLNSLELMGKVENNHGIWYAKTGEQTIKPLEKEIVIELPLPKNKWFDIARLEAYTNYLEEIDFDKVAEINRVFLEKFNETRTIRIKGKNVDELDLEKLGNLIQQATEKSSKFNLRGLFKGLKKSRPDISQRQ